MKKQGFTLIELLAVITIIGLIGIIVYPVILSVIKKNSDKLYENQISNLEQIAYRWSIENENSINENEPYYLSFETLIMSGLIKNEDIINPKTEKKLVGCIKINWETIKNQYDFKYTENCGGI